MSSRSGYEQLVLLAYKQLITLYMRYALLTCFKYTNSKIIAEKILLYTFLTIYRLIENLEHIEEVGQTIDKLIDIISSDMVPEQPRGDEKQDSETSAMLLADKRTQDLATALNMLDTMSRQMLILHYVEMLSTKEISLLYNKSIKETRLEICEAENVFKKHLSELWKRPDALSGSGPASWMSELEDVVDLKLREQMAGVILEHLADLPKHASKIQKYLNLYNSR